MANIVTVGVPHESVLGSLLLNIFINGLCLINLDSEMCNFVDNNALYSCGHDLQEIVTNVEVISVRYLGGLGIMVWLSTPKNFS